MAECMRLIDVGALTANQPFCAGVVWVRNGRVAATLNPDGIPAHLGEGLLRIGGVGGGQEPDETLMECALREAKEELGSEAVRLVSSRITFFHDMDTGDITEVACTDPTAPFLLQRASSKHPDKPYRPGLPVGKYVYFGTYLAELDEARINPEDDVAGLLFVPLEKWPLLEKESLTLGDLLDAGVGLLESHPLARQTRLWMPDNESLRVILPLWEAHHDRI